ncbi:MAG: OmpA family protein [Gammaproteobacteria bacterium]|nr:OmpA family protein [Gammaproteobacteria bacterium]
MKQIKVAALALSATLVFGCAADDPHKRAKTGAVVGGIVGAIAGNQSSSSNGKYVGAAVGALTGAAVGNYMDKQHAKLQEQLAREQRHNEIRITRVDDETLKLELSSEVSFDVNSASVKPSFRDSLNKVADVISEYEQTVVHVIGHTDSNGSTSYNQQLSEKRASSVSKYLARNGVVRSRMRMSGRGEQQPIASNDTSRGRSLNRRVEVYLKAVVEGRENEARRPPA